MLFVHQVPESEKNTECMEGRPEAAAGAGQINGAACSEMREKRVRGLDMQLFDFLGERSDRSPDVLCILILEQHQNIAIFSSFNQKLKIKHDKAKDFHVTKTIQKQHRSVFCLGDLCI